jgi:hypothetical protein
MDRAAEIPSLDNAAKILTGITALVTGLFTGIGFTTGDFIRMIRDFPGKGIAFLVLASTALLIGSFAFVVNAYRSSVNCPGGMLSVCNDHRPMRRRPPDGAHAVPAMYVTAR